MQNHEQILSIAARIKELREISDFQPQDAARRLQISLDEYLSYESGEKDIPISAVIALAEFFGVEVSALLTGGDPRLATYSLTRAGKGVNMAHAHGYSYQALVNNFSGKIAEPFLVTLEPHQANTPVAQNEHSGQEFDYVLEGVMRLVIGETELVLNAGDCVYFNSSYPHGMQPLGETPLKFLAVVL